MNNISYKLKCKNDDFQVTEVSLMPDITLKRPFKYSYVWIQKSGFTTFEILEQIKNFFKLTFDDVRSQGLKDEDAITEQLISIRKILTDKDIAVFNKKYRFKNKFSHIKNIIGYGNEPVKERELHGNSFKIVIRNLEENLAKKFLDYISTNRYFYFINYYDNQRFGMPGGPYNTHLIGKAIVENDWRKAYEYMKNSNNITPEIIAKTKSVSDFSGVFKLINPKKLSFFVSAYNSFLWNKYASLLVKKNTKSKEYLFENVGTLSLPIVSSFQCPHICEAEGYEFLFEKFIARPKGYKRNLIISTTVYSNNLEVDELHKGKKKLTISFFLPTGCYATMIIKQLFFNIENK
jgi:tRNA pseudouridine13 synthase